jgi:hypothetical protein
MWHVSHTAARLIRKGRIADALRLAPPQAYPKTAARVLAG